MPSKQEMIELIKLDRELKIRNARKSLWEYCKLTDGSFCKEDRWHIKLICETLQKLYERKLITEQGEVATGLMISLPPRHGKSRNLVNFTTWALGNNNENRIMTISYNDDQATEFSRFTRDTIMKDKVTGNFVFSDVFPDTKIKRGDASVQKWALEGQFFNYLGCGFGGSATGKGCNIMIIDDPIKSASIAFNDEALDKIYNEYSNTFLSRLEGNNSIQIICMTRWRDKDLCGRILEDKEEAKYWYVLKLPAYNEEKDEMLCNEILNKQSYMRLKRKLDEMIFLANYQQITVDKKGALYKIKDNTYDDIPKDINGISLLENKFCYIDTADTGKDYLAAIVGGIYQGYIYILDIVYTQKSMEQTEKDVADLIYRNNVSETWIESNNGGRGFARNVERILAEKYNNRFCIIHKFSQSKNKQSRILTQSSFVNQRVYFPKDVKMRWDKAWKDLLNYQRTDKNAHDDIEDALTGLVEKIKQKYDLDNINHSNFSPKMFNKGNNLKNVVNYNYYANYKRKKVF
ncbi:phage terminase large subunit [Clostridium botulinum]